MEEAHFYSIFFVLSINEAFESCFRLCEFSSCGGRATQWLGTGSVPLGSVAHWGHPLDLEGDHLEAERIGLSWCVPVLPAGKVPMGKPGFFFLLLFFWVWGGKVAESLISGQRGQEPSRMGMAGLSLPGRVEWEGAQARGSQFSSWRSRVGYLLPGHSFPTVFQFLFLEIFLKPLPHRLNSPFHFFPHLPCFVYTH